MSNFDALHDTSQHMAEAMAAVERAVKHLASISPDGGTEPVVISPTRFEAAYRALSRARTNGGHDYYDQWDAGSQRTHRGYARAVLEGAGFRVQEAT